MARKASELPRKFPGSSSRELRGKFRLGNFRALLLYFWLTIQNTAISQVRNLFSITVVLISFPLARAAAAVAAVDFCCCCCWAWILDFGSRAPFPRFFSKNVAQDLERLPAAEPWV